MPSTFETEAALAFVEHLDHFGVPVTYEDDETDATMVVAIAHHEAETPKAADDDRTERTRTVVISRDTTLDGGGIYTPRRFGVVTVDGETYSVADIQERTPWSTTLRCVFMDDYEVRRENYRA